MSGHLFNISCKCIKSRFPILLYSASSFYRLAKSTRGGLFNDFISSNHTSVCILPHNSNHDIVCSYLSEAVAIPLTS